MKVSCLPVKGFTPSPLLRAITFFTERMLTGTHLLGTCATGSWVAGGTRPRVLAARDTHSGVDGLPGAALPTESLASARRTDGPGCPSCTKMAKVGHRREKMSRHKMAGTGCLGNPKANTAAVCYITSFGRVPLLRGSCIDMALRSQT